MQQSSNLTTAEVERALDAVLARPEYAPVEPPLLYRLAGDFFDWVRDTAWPVVSRFLPDPDWSSPGWELVVRLLFGAGALLGLVLLVYLAVLGVRAWRGRDRRRRAEAELAAGPLTAAVWEARAVEAAGRGDWREAAQALYQAVVLRLGDRGLVQVDPAKTPGDYRREMRRGDPASLPHLDGFLRGFQRVAYGRAEPGPGQYDRLRSSARGLGARA